MINLTAENTSLPETVPSLSHIFHHAQRHAISHTVYQRQCLHSIIFLITHNVMQSHTLFTRDSAFTQSYFSSHPTSCNLTHSVPETVPSLSHISHHTQRHASSHTVYQRQCLYAIIFLITPNVMQAHTLFTRQCLHSIIFLIMPNVMQSHTLFIRDSAFTQSYFSSCPKSSHTQFIRDSAFTQSYFSSHPTSCKLTHSLPETLPSLSHISHHAQSHLTHSLPETVPSLNHISHHAQHHASSHTLYQIQCLHSVIFLITPNIMQAHTLCTRYSAFSQSYFSSHPTSCKLILCTRDSAYTQSYFTSRPTSCKLTHSLPETVPSLSHISHHAQHHASSHTLYQIQCLHSVIFFITPNIMQAHTLCTRDSAFTQSYFSSCPTSCKLTHSVPDTVPSLSHIFHHSQHHASSHTLYQRQCLHAIIFLIMPNVMQAHTLCTRYSAFTQSYFSSQPTSCKLTHSVPDTVPSLSHIFHHSQRHASLHTVYQRLCLHSVIFLITPNVMQAYTPFTRDSGFTVIFLITCLRSLLTKTSGLCSVTRCDIKLEPARSRRVVCTGGAAAAALVTGSCVAYFSFQSVVPA